MTQNEGPRSKSPLMIFFKSPEREWLALGEAMSAALCGVTAVQTWLYCGMFDALIPTGWSQLRAVSQTNPDLTVEEEKRRRLHTSEADAPLLNVPPTCWCRPGQRQVQPQRFVTVRNPSTGTQKLLQKGRFSQSLLNLCSSLPRT